MAPRETLHWTGVLVGTGTVAATLSRGNAEAGRRRRSLPQSTDGSGASSTGPEHAVGEARLTQALEVSASAGELSKVGELEAIVSRNGFGTLDVQEWKMFSMNSIAFAQDARSSAQLTPRRMFSP